MNKKSFCLVALSALIVIGCGGGGSNSGGDEEKATNLPPAFNDFFPSASIISNLDSQNPSNPSKPYLKAVIYSTSYDGLTQSEAKSFLNKLNSKGFNCSGQLNNIRESDISKAIYFGTEICTLNNPSQDITRARGEATNLYVNGYVVGETIAGNANLATNNNVFTAFPNKRQVDYTIGRCYTGDITNDIIPYRDRIIDNGFTLDPVDGFYKRIEGDLIYVWGYSQTTVGWNVALINNGYTWQWIPIDCENF
ncbi:MAG: hypothetical protein LBT96_05375 [Campylobacteraceae bacterium]|jgi:hypothetical protein|nr:hypothetical protein [Campylobacteraceae bacterium]